MFDGDDMTLRYYTHESKRPVTFALRGEAVVLRIRSFLPSLTFAFDVAAKTLRTRSFERAEIYKVITVRADNEHERDRWLAAVSSFIRVEKPAAPVVVPRSGSTSEANEPHPMPNVGGQPARPPHVSSRSMKSLRSCRNCGSSMRSSWSVASKGAPPQADAVPVSYMLTQLRRALSTRRFLLYAGLFACIMFRHHCLVE